MFNDVILSFLSGASGDKHAKKKKKEKRLTSAQRRAPSSVAAQHSALLQRPHAHMLPGTAFAAENGANPAERERRQRQRMFQIGKCVISRDQRL